MRVGQLRKTLAAFAAAATCWSAAPLAYEEARALKELGFEYAACAAYFQFVSMVEPDRAGEYQVLASSAASMAGRLAGMDAAADRWSVTFEALRRTLAEDRAKLAEAMADHRQQCAAVVGDSDARLRYWLAKED